jgi:DNA-binding MarR family transcriptional regulator
MINRKQKVEELLMDLQLLRRTMALQSTGSGDLPRITPSQWGVLMLIERKGGSTIKAVAKGLSMTSSAATQLVDGLVANGYLTRKEDTGDRRTISLTLSKKSKNHVDRMKKRALQKFLTVFKILSDREFDQYVALNKKIVQGSVSKKILLYDRN